MRKKITAKEWKDTHPYCGTDQSDLYYTKIANSVLVALKSTYGDDTFDRNKIKRVALALTSWFEDVISDVGIWQAFISECKRRYGTYLPFYDTSEDNYFSDEINLADVQFLLWHYVQQYEEEKLLINPENNEIRAMAEAAYEIFDQEYEQAPENQTLNKFFVNLEITSESFFPLRKVMEWFSYSCYLNIHNEDELFDITEDFFERNEIEKLSLEYARLTAYNIRVDHFLSVRNILAYTSYQWLALIIKDPVKLKILESIIYRRNIGVTFCSLDEKYLYVKEVGSKGQIIKITNESFEPQSREMFIGKTSLTSLLYFDGDWWISGGLIEADKYTLEKRANEIQNRKEMIKESIDHFVEKSKGKRVLFFKDTDEYAKFARNVLEFKGKKSSFYPPESKGQDLFVCANIEGGIYNQFQVCSCLKHRDNPLYDPEESSEYAHLILLDNEVPYQVSTLMIDEGLLADAKMFSPHGEEHGHKLMQDNIYFINDYFRQRCRDLDYTE